MKKSIIIVLFVLTNSATFSQHNIFGLYFSPTVNYRALKGFVDAYDESTFHFNCGLSYERKLGSQSGILTGLDYSISGYLRQRDYYYGDYVYDYKYALHYIGIPVAINYDVVNGTNFRIGVQAGVNFKYLIYAGYTPENVQKIPSIPGSSQLSLPRSFSFTSNEISPDVYNKLNSDVMIGVRFCYSINNIILGISPEFRYALKRTTKVESEFHSEKEYLYSFGLKLAAGYAIR